jgi:hypothetical protein
MGLGANSTLLTALKETGSIASRSWSVYWGNSGAPATQTAGVFIFGGYDKTKIQGTGFTFPLSNYTTHCNSGMLLSITDISLTYPNGTNASLFAAASESLQACILPDYPVLMTLPGDATLGNNKDYYQNLLNLMGVPNDLNLHSVGLNFWGEIFSSSYNLVDVIAQR